MKYLGGEYAHYRLLCKKQWFAEALKLWTDELDTLLRSESLRTIDETARGTSQSAFQAAKYLANLEHRKASTGRGRPSKEEVLGELARSAKEAASTDDDYQRVFVTSDLMGGNLTEKAN